MKKCLDIGLKASPVPGSPLEQELTRTVSREVTVTVRRPGALPGPPRRTPVAGRFNLDHLLIERTIETT
jgi:hypothetical protein